MPRFASRHNAPKKRVFKRKRYGQRRQVASANKVGGMYNSFASTLRPLVARNPFPLGQRVTVSYAEPFTMTTGVSAFGTQQTMRLNSIYDPNQSGVGHLCYGHPNLAALYGKYRVDRVSWKITLTTPGAANDQYIAATMAPNTSGNLTGATLFNPIEDPSSTVGLMSGNGDRRAVIYQTVDLHKLIGVSRAKYEADDTFSSGMSSNPAQIAYLNFATCCADGSSGVTAQALIEMHFDVWVYDRITVN